MTEYCEPPRFIRMYLDEQLALAGYFEDKPAAWRYFWAGFRQVDLSTGHNHGNHFFLRPPCY